MKPNMNIDIDAIHKALANPVRRQILAWLKRPEAYFADQAHPLTFGVCASLITNAPGCRSRPYRPTWRPCKRPAW